MHRDQSPASIRSEVFGHRLRGLDEEEVRDYLDLLAEQVERSNAEIGIEGRSKMAKGELIDALRNH